MNFFWLHASYRSKAIILDPTDFTLRDIGVALPDHDAYNDLARNFGWGHDQK
jgi:hypothetical protein